MKNTVIKILRKELRSYREQLVTGNFTALQLCSEAYRIVIKQEIVDAVERFGEEETLPEQLWNWMASKSEILEYLYQLMVYSDYSFLTEFMEVLHREVEHDREVHGNE